MKNPEFIQKVTNKEIPNGTIFDVYYEEQIIGQVGVIRDIIVYFEFINNEIPKDLLTGDYDFIEYEEGE